MPENTGKSHDSHRQKTVRSLVYLLIFFVYLVPIVIVFRQGFDDYFQLFRRLTGLTGITSLFIAIIISSFIRQAKKIFGIVYIKIHHLFSITGLILITLHPIIMVIDFGASRILIPDFSSWNAFLTNAGRPSLYLIYIATFAAILRKNIRKYWKYIHGLIYIAFVLGAIHGMRQGSDLQNPILLSLYLIMIVITNFIYKRYLNYNK